MCCIHTHYIQDVHKTETVCMFHLCVLTRAADTRKNVSATL